MDLSYAVLVGKSGSVRVSERAKVRRGEEEVCCVVGGYGQIFGRGPKASRGWLEGALSIDALTGLSPRVLALEVTRL